MKEISIVIPVYNSQGNLKELNRQIRDALQGVEYELILVNDGSTDNSWDIIKELVKNEKNITAVNLRKNFGQDNALMAGLKFVTGHYIVIMDDDLQHSPYDILTLYNKCREGYDICYARFMKKNQTVWKNFGSRMNGAFARFLLQKPKGVYMSPFKIVRSEVVKEILKYSGPFPYLEGLLLQVTGNVTCVNATHQKRYSGKGNFNFIRSVSVFLRTLTSFSVMPLRLATLIGFITSILGFLGAFYYLIEYIFISKTVEGWTSLIISTLIIGGLLLMFMGLIGEYLGRIFLAMNNKPQYSVCEVLGRDATV
ncbi:MAG: glycosyltransferase family 2 protein [Bacteroidia bacterium]|nr:glycosyltransferase family 2 protein [Bacteroidia bacterium]